MRAFFSLSPSVLSKAQKIILFIGLSLCLPAKGLLADANTESLQNNKTTPQKILVSVKPLALIFESFKREGDVVEVLVHDGASNHDFRLKPSDIKKIAKADLVIWSGAEYEPYLEKSLAKKNRQLNIMALDTIDYIDLTNKEKHDHEKKTHGHGSLDVHVWFDSGNAVALAKAMAKAALYPEYSTAVFEQDFRKNHTATVTQTDAQTLGNNLASTKASIIVYHDAYRYLEREIGLKHDFVINPDHQLSFGLKHWQAFMQQLESDLETNKRSCIITQAGFDKSALAARLANQKNIRFVEIDALAADKNYPDYFSFWRENKNKLKSCFLE